MLLSYLFVEIKLSLFLAELPHSDLNSHLEGES